MVDLEMHSIQNPAWKRETICSFMQSCQLLGNAFLLQRLFSAQHEGEVEEEEDEEVEEEKEEDEGKVV